MPTDEQMIQSIADELERAGRLGELRRFMQHGDTSVYSHSLAVARRALHIGRALRLRLNERAMIRGALLHDYFLYDWHVPDPNRPLHGFAHPRIALENARRDYGVNATEADVIRRHMFPLTPVPPSTREGWVVCLADTLCAVGETMNRRRAALILSKLLSWKEGYHAR